MENLLTFEKLKYTNKLCEIVYTMKKRGYNKSTDKKGGICNGKGY